MRKLLKSGTIITSSETVKTDLLIEDEKISLIGQDLKVEDDMEVFDLTGKFVLPGGVDAHVHLDLPMFGTVSSDDHYTGTRAAAFGGTTSVIDFVSQDEPDLQTNIEKLHQKADAKAAVDFGFHMNISQFSQDILRQLPGLVDQGITSIKMFTAYNNRLRLQDTHIYQVMRAARDYGFLTLLHAENGDVIDLLVSEALQKGHTSPEWHGLTRPAWGAVESAFRGISFAAQTGAPLYLVHMNAAGEVDQLKSAREKGVPVMGETCPQYLFFTMEELRREDGAKWICSPPMREKEDNQRLWRGLQEGTIQVLSTDHCPFFYNGQEPILFEGEKIAIPGKELGRGDFTKIPNGLPGVADRLPIFWTKGVLSGRISPNQFVSLTSTNPAKIFGLYPQKGSLMPGADADIAIWDPEMKVRYGQSLARQRTDYNLYEGWQLTGFPEKVFLRGNLIVDGQTWLGKAGQGRFIHRKAFENLI